MANVPATRAGTRTVVDVRDSMGRASYRRPWLRNRDEDVRGTSRRWATRSRSVSSNCSQGSRGTAHRRAPCGASLERIKHHAVETRRASPRGHAVVHRHGRADPRPRHRRQHRDLQRRIRRPAEAAAVSALRRARGARSRRARLRHTAGRRRPVSLFHVSRGRAGSSRTSRCGERARSASPASPSPKRVPALFATDGLLPILGVQPMLGRVFSRADDAPGGAETVVLTAGYWRPKFGADRAAVGRDGDVRRPAARDHRRPARRASASATATCRWSCRSGSIAARS